MTREEQLACLTDRPCEVCKFHGENGCCRWKCVFEEEPTDAEPCEDESGSEKPNNCTACIIDGTDACSRGAGRAVDGRVCEDFVGESEDK